MTAFSPLFRYAEPVPFDPAVKNSWGSPISGNFTLVEQSIGGVISVNVGGQTAVTLSTANGASDQARTSLIQFTGALNAVCTVTIPNLARSLGFAENNTTGGFNIILTAGAGAQATLPADGFQYLYTSDGGGNVSLVRLGVGALTTPGVAQTVTQLVATGGVTASGFDSGGAQFRATQGNYGVFLRNDGTSAALLQTASGNPSGASNNLVPFSWKLSNGAVMIDGTGAGTTFGGGITTGSQGIKIGGSTNFSISQSGVNQLINFAPNEFIQFNPIIGLELASTGEIAFNAPLGMFLNGFRVVVADGGTYAINITGTASDRRMKTGIHDISPDDAITWVQSGRPVRFLLDGKPSAGFIAQEDIAAGRGAAVTAVPDKDPRFAESDGYAEPGTRLVRDYHHDNAYLTRALQEALRRIDALASRVALLTAVVELKDDDRR